MITYEYVQQATDIFSSIIQSLEIENAPERLYFIDSNAQNIADATQHGETIILVSSTPIEIVEDVLIHELSHWILGKNWLFVEQENWHGEWFLAMQFKMYGNIEAYKKSACFIMDKSQNGYSNHSFLKACEIFNKVNINGLSVDDFAKKLTVLYNNEYKKTFKYKYEFLVQVFGYSAIACFFTYQLFL